MRFRYAATFIAASMLGLTVLSGCNTQIPEAVDEAVEDAGEATDEAIDDAGEAIDDAAEVTEDAVNDAAEDVEEATE